MRMSTVSLLTYTLERSHERLPAPVRELPSARCGLRTISRRRPRTETRIVGRSNPAGNGEAARTGGNGADSPDEKAPGHRCPAFADLIAKPTEATTPGFYVALSF